MALPISSASRSGDSDRLRDAPRRRRPLQVPRHWPPGRGRAHADTAPGSPAGRSPRSRDTVEAPEREMTRCAAAMRCGMSEKKGGTSTSHAELGIGLLDASDIVGARLLRHLQPGALRLGQARRSPPAPRRRRTARPGCRRRPAAGTARRSRDGRYGVFAASSTAGRTGLPVTTILSPNAAARLSLQEAAGNRRDARPRAPVGAAHHRVLLVHDASAPCAASAANSGGSVG